MAYQCIALSASAFVHLLMRYYLPHGYYFYALVPYPKHTCPTTLDAKLISDYRIDVSSTTRGRRKKGARKDGKAANIRLLRHGHFGILLAQEGPHETFYGAESIRSQQPFLKDARRKTAAHPNPGYEYQAIAFDKYLINCSADGKHSELRLKPKFAKQITTELKKKYRKERKTLERITYDLRWKYEEFYHVRSQIRNSVRAMNELRIKNRLPIVRNKFPNDPKVIHGGHTLPV